MVGLPSLMQQPGQAPQPGQAAPPGVGAMPPGMAQQPQAAPTPGGVTGQLSKLPPEQLLAMYNNPQDTTPKLSVAGAYAQAVEQQRLMQMAQGQTAMAQNAQQQQQMPVVQELMSQAQPQEPQQPPPVMAARGGMMRGYAGGGAVAFDKGGVAEDLQDDPSLPLMERIRRARLRQEAGDTSLVQRPVLEMLMSRLRGETPAPAAARPAAQPVDTSKLFPFGVPESPMMDVPEIQIAPSAPSLRGGPSGAPSRQPAAAPAPAQAMTPAGMTPEERQTYIDYRAMMEGRKTRPESLVKAEQGLAELAQANIAAQRAESERMAREAQERRDAALARSQRSILQDPQALLALAGSIDTRKGQGIGSLARGAAGLLGQREAAAEAARKEFATSQQAQRAMDATIRQTQMLEAQRQVALERGNYDLVNQLDDKIAQSKLAEQNAAREIQNKAIEQARLERGVAAQERSVDVQAQAARTAAGRETELEFFRRDPEGYAKFKTAQYGPRGAGRAMTYNEASDNVQRLLDSPSGMMEVMNIRRQAKEAGRPEPSLIEVKEMLIQRELQGAGARVPAPSGGKVMTMADVQATATASGRTVDEVRKAAIAAGYTIQ